VELVALFARLDRADEHAAGTGADMLVVAAC
jgi:hypothetical protein